MNSANVENSVNVDNGHVVGGNELTVEIFSPRSPQPKKFTWAKSLQVGQAADEAAKAFGYEAGNPTFQDKTGQVLERDKTLIESGIQDFDRLELTDKGGGV